MKILILNFVEILCMVLGFCIPYAHLKSNFSREKSPHISRYCWAESVVWFMVLFLGIPGMIHGFLIKSSENWTTVGAAAGIMTIIVLAIWFILFMTYKFPWGKLVDFFRWE